MNPGDSEHELVYDAGQDCLAKNYQTKVQVHILSIYSVHAHIYSVLKQPSYSVDIVKSFTNHWCVVFQ